MSIAIRVPPETHERLQALATARKQSIGQVVTAAVQQLGEERFWEELEAAFERLSADPAAAAEYEAETTAWDATLLDGLETDPWVEYAVSSRHRVEESSKMPAWTRPLATNKARFARSWSPLMTGSTPLATVSASSSP